MGSGQLLTLRWLAQLPAEPSAGRKAANIWRTFLRERLQSGTPGREKCTCTHVGPRGRLFPRALGLVFLVLFRSPFSPGPQPHPPRPSRPSRLRPAEPPSLAASPRQRAPSICRKTPPFFNAPGASPSFREPPDSNLVNEESGPGSPRGRTQLQPRSQAGRQPHRGWARPPLPRPRALAGPCPVSRQARGAAWTGGLGGSRDAPRRGRTDSWREGEGVGVEGGRGFIGVTFQKNSQRVAGVTPRG